MSDAVTGWTEERVELLGRLWQDGHSASQIAAQLGGGVTRNAVIGKVHRLGLAGRAKAPGNAAAARPAGAKPRPEDGVVVPFPARPAETVPAVIAAEEGGVPAEVVNIPVSQRVSILELREWSCRWPLGDPNSAEFGFCGGRAATGHPYCVAHCRIAYQPAADRRRLRV